MTRQEIEDTMDTEHNPDVSFAFDDIFSPKFGPLTVHSFNTFKPCWKLLPPVDCPMVLELTHRPSLPVLSKEHWTSFNAQEHSPAQVEVLVCVPLPTT